MSRKVNQSSLLNFISAPKTPGRKNVALSLPFSFSLCFGSRQTPERSSLPPAAASSFGLRGGGWQGGRGATERRLRRRWHHSLRFLFFENGKHSAAPQLPAEIVLEDRQSASSTTTLNLHRRSSSFADPSDAGGKQKSGDEFKGVD